MSEPRDLNLLGRWTPLIAAVVLVAIVGVVVVVSRESGRDRKPADLGDEFKYDVECYKVIPKEKIGYLQVGQFPTGMKKVTAIAVGPKGRIAVGGDELVRVFGPGGEHPEDVAVGAAPLALTISEQGRLFVATKDRVGQGTPLRWLLKLPGEKARITSIAVDEEHLFVADAGSRVVWRYTRDGQPRGRIGDADPEHEVPGFSIPSPYFDVFAAPDGLLRIVDPGRKKITAFTREGHLELSWGNPTFALEGFSGCCNPAHFTMLRDGSYVTSEKGIPRVKVYNIDGEFVTAVVGMDGLSTETEPCDVATDSEGLVYVLDPGAKAVRIFEKIEETDSDK